MWRVGTGVWWRFLTILEEGWRIYMGSKREVGLKEEIGLVHRGPRKSQLLSTPPPRQWFWRKGVIQCNSLPRGREYKVDLVKGSRCLFKSENFHFPAVSGIHRKLSHPCAVWVSQQLRQLIFLRRNIWAGNRL